MMEELKDDIKSILSTQTIILNRLDAVEKEISMAKIVAKTLKWVGICIVALFTFKFGDVKSLLDYIRS